jgi:hypothetical protein
MPPASNLTYVEQSVPSKVPLLHPGDISPIVMREYEDACTGYFDHKSIAEDKQVRMIAAGLKDMRIHDWFSADHACLCSLTFLDFLVEFRRNYLEDDWEETMHRELLSMMQGSASFWEFAVSVQAKNSLLTGTSSHLEEDKLHHQLEATMEETVVPVKLVYYTPATAGNV